MNSVLRKFTPWKPWSERTELELSSPGIYLLAKAPRDGKPSKSSKLLYVGETCGQTLRSRLSQFNRSAFLGKRAHSGGARFARTFRLRSAPAWLHISILGTTEKEPRASAYIRYLERALIWNHVQAHGVPPTCNSK